MTPFDAIDVYCERIGPEWWSEPVNALTNIGFLLAAYLLLRRRYPLDIQPEVRLLGWLIALVGIGSGLFHTFGKVWGSWLDVGFIALFILTYLHRFLRRLGGTTQLGAWMVVIAFVVLDRGVSAFGNLGLNGSEAYVLPGVTLGLLALWARRVAPAAVPWLTWALVCFVASFTLRTLDMALCPVWPLGTHFGWHLLNAMVLYLCVRGLAAGCRPQW
ncbi:MAG: ceramidase domain-containing protein [Rhodocyclaceae bacterium]